MRDNTTFDWPSVLLDPAFLACCPSDDTNRLAALRVWKPIEQGVESRSARWIGDKDEDDDEDDEGEDYASIDEEDGEDGPDLEGLEVDDNRLAKMRLQSVQKLRSAWEGIIKRYEQRGGSTLPTAHARAHTSTISAAASAAPYKRDALAILSKLSREQREALFKFVLEERRENVPHGTASAAIATTVDPRSSSIVPERRNAGERGEDESDNDKDDVEDEDDDDDVIDFGDSSWEVALLNSQQSNESRRPPSSALPTPQPNNAAAPAISPTPPERRPAPRAHTQIPPSPSRAQLLAAEAEAERALRAKCAEEATRIREATIAAIMARAVEARRAAEQKQAQLERARAAEAQRAAEARRATEIAEAGRRAAEEALAEERLRAAEAKRIADARQQAQRELHARQNAERERLARFSAERERLARLSAERERLARLNAERERLAEASILAAKAKRVAEAKEAKRAAEAKEAERAAKAKAKEAERVAKAEEAERMAKAKEAERASILAKRKANEANSPPPAPTSYKRQRQEKRPSSLASSDISSNRTITSFIKPSKSDIRARSSMPACLDASFSPLCQGLGKCRKSFCLACGCVSSLSAPNN